MNENEKAAYIISQSVCAMIEAMAMASFNKTRELRGESLGYDEGAFFDLIERYNIHHNGVIGLFNDV